MIDLHYRVTCIYTDDADFLCDFEKGSLCPFLPDGQITPTLGWKVAQAGRLVSYDHTVNSSK